MKKDTFNLRNYLVENKMTVNSRTTKKPLGQVVLNEKVLIPVDEAGYTDFHDEDEDDYEKDLDFSAGDSLVGKIGGSNKRAKKAAEKEMGSFDEPEQDDKEVSFEDPEDLEGDETEDAGQSFNIKYDPETVNMYMDDEELQEFLQGFRRPQVAAKVLQRAINQAQDEIDNSPGVSKLYLYLKNGFYHTDVFAKPGATIIGTFISKEKAARNKRF